MAEITLEGLQEGLVALQKKVEEQAIEIASLKESAEKQAEEVSASSGKVEEVSAALVTVAKAVEGISSLPIEAPKKDAPSILEAAENKAKGSEPVVHFSHEKKNYAFIADFVSVPAGVEGLAMGSKISAKAAQSNKALQKKLVETNSGQIKEVL